MKLLKSIFFFYKYKGFKSNIGKAEMKLTLKDQHY